MIATCKSKRLTLLATLLLSLVLLLSVWTVPAYAEETTEAVTEAATEAVTESDTQAETTADTAAETSATTTADTAAETSATTTADTAADTSESAAEKKERLTRSLINLGVGALILIVLVVLCIKFRSKIPGWWKALKAECGKISWCSKDKLKKNTFVVVIIIVAIAVAIGLLDYAFSKGLIMLGNLFH